MNARLTNRTAYRGDQNPAGLTLSEIRDVAPSVFADAPHGSRSQRYAYIPTSVILSNLLNEGFVCTKAQQARTRIEGKEDFTKHLLVFTRARSDSEIAPSVALLNSHDGSSRYKLLAGILRYACLNGLLVSEGTVGEVSVPHTGNVVGRVIEGSFEVIEGAQRAIEVASDWKKISLALPERVEFARAASLLRWDGQEQVAPVSPNHLLTPRRYEDRGTDLWTTYNVIQENLVKSGLKGNTRDAAGRRRGVRALTGIDGNVALNRALWSLTQGLADLKAAA